MEEKSSERNLPPIPDKLYFSIGETSSLCGIKPHVLRYWEQQFVQLQPIRRRGNRRSYRRQDLLLIRRIHDLLYQQGYTIRGAREFLSGEEGRSDMEQSRQVIRQMISELSELKKLLDK